VTTVASRWALWVLRCLRRRLRWLISHSSPFDEECEWTTFEGVCRKSNCGDIAWTSMSGRMARSVEA
jgi:hypothetical protein